MTVHFMVDIETLSTHTNAVVLSIGAVRFDPISGKIEEELYATLRPQDQVERKIDSDTVMWWMKQVAEDPTKINAFNSESKIPIRQALIQLSAFLAVDTGEDRKVWACDPDFDLAILADLYHQFNIPIPWKFFEGRSVRTVRDIATALGRPKLSQLVTHNALEDCKRQTIEIQQLYSWLHYITGGSKCQGN